MAQRLAVLTGCQVAGCAGWPPSRFIMVIDAYGAGLEPLLCGLARSGDDRSSTPPPSTLLSVEVALDHTKAAVGQEVGASVKVRAGARPVTDVRLGVGLSATEQAVVTRAPSGSNGFDLPADGSRTFDFELKGAKEGKATLSVDATGDSAAGGCMVRVALC